MNNLMKSFFRSSIVTSILLMILGGLLVFESEATIISISYIIGGILIALGLVAILRYIRNAKKITGSELDILYGIVTIILGALVISHPKALVSIIPIVLGIFIVANSSTKIQYAFELKRDNNSLWVMTMIVAVVSAICGVVLIFNPFKGAKMITQIVGIFIILYSILDVVSTLTIRRNVITIQNVIEDTIKDAVIVDEESENSISENSKKKKRKKEEK